MSPTTTRRVVRQRAKGPVDPAVGQRVKHLRSSRGLTQAEIAGGDFSKGFISLVETGRTRVSLRAAEIIARRLGVTVSDLIGATTLASEKESEFLVLRAEQEISAGRAANALDTATGLERKMAPGLLRTRLRRLRARAFIELGRSREALPLLDQVHREFRQFGQLDFAARALLDLARAHEQLDQAGEMLHYLLACERAIEAGEIIDRTLELNVHRMLAKAYVRLGDFAAADLRADRALALAAEVSDPRSLAELYASVAIARQEGGDFEAAITYARKSLDLYEGLEQRSAVGMLWNNLAWLYTQRRHLAKADDALARAREVAAEIKSPALEAWARASEAEVAMARGDAAGAMQIASEVLATIGIGARLRAEASLIRARAMTQKSPATASKKAFEDAIRASSSEPPRWKALVHQEFARALAGRGAVREAYEQSAMALDLLQQRKS